MGLGGSAEEKSLGISVLVEQGRKPGQAWMLAGCPAASRPRKGRRARVWPRPEQLQTLLWCWLSEVRVPLPVTAEWVSCLPACGFQGEESGLCGL